MTTGDALLTMYPLFYLPRTLCACVHACREEEESFDPEALERKRLKEAERWRQQQLATGAPEDNPNLQVRTAGWSGGFTRDWSARGGCLNAHERNPGEPTAATGQCAAPGMCNLPAALNPNQRIQPEAVCVQYGITAARDRRLEGEVRSQGGAKGAQGRRQGGYLLRRQGGW